MKRTTYQEISEEGWENILSRKIIERILLKIINYLEWSHEINRKQEGHWIRVIQRRLESKVENKRVVEGGLSWEKEYCRNTSTGYVSSLRSKLIINI